jgi:ligand-binding sensor domain-containing protein
MATVGHVFALLSPMAVAAPTAGSEEPDDAGKRESRDFRIFRYEYDQNDHSLVSRKASHPRALIESFVYGEEVTNVVLDARAAMLPSVDRVSNELMDPVTNDEPPAFPPRPQYHIDQWTSENGLPANKVWSLLQTRDGYLWIGTANGLARFDGVRFATFTPENVPQMLTHGSSIRSLYEDDQGALWIGTDAGLLCYASGAFATIAGQEANTGRIHGLERRAVGGFWIAADRGLGFWSNNEIRWMSVTENYRVLAVAEDGKGSVWFGSEAGLFEFDSIANRIVRSLLAVPRQDSLVIPKVIGLFFDSRKRLWIGSDSGAFRMDRPDAVPVPLPYSAARPFDIPFGSNFAEDAQGVVWATTMDSGAGLYGYAERDLKTSSRTQIGEDLGWTRTVLVDREGVLWTGTQHGLFRLRRKPFATVQLNGASRSSDVRSVTIDQQGALWFSIGESTAHWSGYDLAVFDWVTFASTRPFAAPDRFGHIWAPFNSRGVLRISDFSTPAKPPTLHAPQLTNKGEVVAMHRGPSGNLWIGMRDGLYRIAETGALEQVQNLADPISLLDDGTHLWVGTKAGDVYQLPSMVPLWENSADSKSPVIALHRSADGVLWIGTPSGLHRFARSRLLGFGSASGLPQGPIHGILEDDTGRLWLNTGDGIVRVAREGLDKWLADPSRVPALAVFGRKDGLSLGNRSSGSQSCVKGTDGRLWFAKRNGLVVVNPSESPPLPVPHVLVETVLVNEANLARGYDKDEADLPPGSGEHLEFLFTATSLHSPEKVRIRYRLDGFDPAWREAGTGRRARYSKIPPGTYVFRVQACNHEGVWSERDAVFAFRISPHFWQTGIFPVLCVTALGGTLAGAKMWSSRRRRRHLARERQHLLAGERARIARDIHDHLGAHLSELVFTLGEENSAEARQKAQESLKELQDAIWALRPENDTLSSLADFIAEFAERYLSAAGLNLQIDAPPPSGRHSHLQ